MALAALVMASACSVQTADSPNRSHGAAPSTSVSQAAPSPSATEPDDPALTELRARPSLLVDVDTERGCPVSEPQRIVGTALAGLGAEPLYLTGLNATVTLRDTAQGDGDRYLEARWLRLPSQTQPLLVRGAELDTDSPVDFRLPDASVVNELYLTTGTSEAAEAVGPDYRSWATLVGVPVPGCYGLQVEGIGHFGGYVIVFEVQP